MWVGNLVAWNFVVQIAPKHKHCHHILKSTSHSLYADLTELLIINNFKEYVGF